jgi:hypothetical protein
MNSTADNQQQHGFFHHHEGGGHGDQHADHAVGIALARAGRRGQALERQDEQHRRHQVQHSRNILHGGLLISSS